jgi:hypothetical protein
MDKERIIAEIKRTTAENGDVPPGVARFATITGIKRGVWRGKYWRSWSEALIEAGFAPNVADEARTQKQLVLAMIKLVQQHQRFPTHVDLRWERRFDDTFPSHRTFERLGDRPTRIALVRAYAMEHPEYRDVLDLLPASDDDKDVDETGSDTASVDGAVYMLKLGKHFKIGKSFRVPQRHREISLELPEKPDVVHVITTDDPTGIEAYWHKRFEARHTNGEWFALTREDIRAFKRRKFM